MLYKEIHAPQRELCGCQKRVEWEVTIAVHYTVITDLSLLRLTILYLSVEGVRFQTALVITRCWTIYVRLCMIKFLSWQHCLFFLNVSCALYF